MLRSLKIFLAVFIIAFFYSGAAHKAHAQIGCAPYSQMTDTLKVKFGESMLGMGITSAKSIVEIWASYKNGTWTVLLTNSDGLACIKASGTRWVEPIR